MNLNADQLYGKWAVGDARQITTLNAGHVLGSRLRSGPDGKPAWIDLQWQDPSGRTVQLEMPFVQAMFVLSLLKSHQLDTGLPFPDDPRAPQARR